MAKGEGGASDWTAGIVAILAAVLLGAALPIGLYYGLYVPQTEALAQARLDLEAVEARQAMLSAKAERVKTLEDEGAEIAERLSGIEVEFVSPDGEGFTLDAAVLDIEDLASAHHLSPRRQTSGTRDLNVVRPAGGALEFPDGLRATRYMVEAQARFHDFGRFLAALESRDGYTIIPEDLLCRGDAARGTQHIFVLNFYIVQKRDVDEIGT